MSNLKLSIENFDKNKAEAFVNEMIPLGVLHWAEEGNTTAFNPNIQFYGYAWESEGFRIITARNTDGVLVGYAVVMVDEDRNDGVKAGTMGAIFLKKEYRGGGNGRSLFEFAVVLMRALGAKRVLANAVPGTPYERWLKQSGYKAQAVAYVYEY